MVEWALLTRSQKKLYRDVMRETFRNLAAVGQKWGDQTIKYVYRDPKKSRRRQVLKRCEHEESRQRGKMFSWNLEYIINMKTGIKPCETHVCGQACTGHLSYERHIVSDSGHTKRPYKCKKCGKAFKWPCDLRNHERTHTGEKPYKCQQCGKTFGCSTYYRRHARTHTGEKPYVCMHCGKGFRCSSFLQIHERIHTGEKPYVCTHCGKAFTRASTLRIHERNHNGEKPYVCEQCGKAFREYGKMKRHEKIHTRQKSYVCEHCWKVFRFSSSFQKHERTHAR
uniref:Zinc finger protein 833 isoform X2 n=1 Tax=Castor canadensis TaxID=51338 RepID=A0A8B7TN97_CASCN|nr:putative zinc finger protein 833 isoform X2 [Castor canadensis]